MTEEIFIPEMTKEEEENIHFYMQRLSLDCSSIGDLEHHLLRELAEIERENFETLFDEKAISSGEHVVSMIDDASIFLQEMVLLLCLCRCLSLLLCLPFPLSLFPSFYLSTS